MLPGLVGLALPAALHPYLNQGLVRRCDWPRISLACQQQLALHSIPVAGVGGSYGHGDELFTNVKKAEDARGYAISTGQSLLNLTGSVYDKYLELRGRGGGSRRLNKAYW